MIYLASPYSNDNPNVRQLRYDAVAQKTAEMLRAGEIVFSPIAHCHPLAEAYTLPTSFEFWKTYCLAMLAKADRLHVLTLPGWDTSRGVTAEIVFALQNDIPIDYIEVPRG